MNYPEPRIPPVIRPSTPRKMVTFFDYKGLIAPVFTAFNDDESKSLNVRNIDRYAKWLKSKNINGIMVNGITGEGPTLNLAERKLHAEYWWRAAVENELMMMLQIGGGPLPDVIEMAILAEKLNVHCVCCLPDVFYKPRNIDQLVAYCRIVSKSCSSRPFFYYHVPNITDVKHDLVQFCQTAQQFIPNFKGLYFSDVDLDLALRCRPYATSIYISVTNAISNGVLLGFEVIAAKACNILPELCFEVYQYTQANNGMMALKAQTTLNELVANKLKPDLRTTSADPRAINILKKWFTDTIGQKHVNMPVFCNRAEDSMPNFYGLMYSHKDIESAQRCKGFRRCIFLAVSGMQLSGYMLGFETLMIGATNIVPNICVDLYNACKENNIALAKIYQNELNELLNVKLSENDWELSIMELKYWFNEQMLSQEGADFTAGPARIVYPKTF